ncbi:16S rRNA (guanine(527)-N(7))-methyltransferase RsmG [Hydrogenimonas sp. SS33]|uniref:16S rRNA (guanine(527)-N(7))-methyltransferase RsmG n=1 Tax=Hydrogenimonas leucolamina TaxID=2954236 RepID=UPI00336BC9AB
MPLTSLLETNGLTLDKETVTSLERFAALLMEWNRVHNLTGAKTEEAIGEQILDSLWPVTFLPTPYSLLDIGTGAGFPGLVLAIALPDTPCTLCEPLQKRAAFLRYAAGELGLKNVTVEARRVEALPARPYSLITSRAVTETRELIGWSRPFIDETTQMLFYKGEQVFSEIEGLQRCDIELVTRDKRHYLWIKEANRC